MEFLIPLRNAHTGAEKNFHNPQQIADFLRDEANPEHWEGHAHLGALPEPTPVEPEEAEEIYPIPVEDPNAVLPKGEPAAPKGTETPAPEAPASNPVARAVAAVKKAVAKKPAAKKATK